MDNLPLLPVDPGDSDLATILDLLRLLLTTDAVESMSPDGKDALLQKAGEAMEAGFNACIRKFNEVAQSNRMERNRIPTD